MHRSQIPEESFPRVAERDRNRGGVLLQGKRGSDQARSFGSAWANVSSWK